MDYRSIGYDGHPADCQLSVFVKLNDNYLFNIGCLAIELYSITSCHHWRGIFKESILTRHKAVRMHETHFSSQTDYILDAKDLYDQILYCRSRGRAFSVMLGPAS